MRLLLLHQNFPAQFRDVAVNLAARPGNEVIYITNREEGSLQGVRKLVYPKPRATGRELHPYLRQYEQAILHGQAAYRVADQLKRAGWVPDVIYGHTGFGPTLFMRDVFPRTPLLCQFEWYYHAHGTDVGFDPAEPTTPDMEAKLRVKNASILSDLVSCQAGCAPTEYQFQQFPPEFRSKLMVMHEGIDTVYFTPQRAPIVIERLGLDLSHAKEVITYVARGMEPYRGFPQFLRAMEKLQRERPECHVVILGEDRCAYGSPRKDGKTWKTVMLEELQLDLARTHFTGLLTYREYRQVLHGSAAHVYLTYPFVLSWSLMEAMACGCNIIASDTDPVREVIADGREGLLTDFFDTDRLVQRITESLENPAATEERRQRARAAMVERYALNDILPRKIAWLQSWIGKG